MKKRKRYSDSEKTEIVDKVIDLMSESPMKEACRSVGVSASNFLRWKDGVDDSVKDRYARARIDFVERLAAETLEIADEVIPVNEERGGLDNAAVQRNRLRVDTRKWLLSKLSPSRYGDKLTLAGDEENPLAISTVTKKIVDPKDDDTK